MEESVPFFDFTEESVNVPREHNFWIRLKRLKYNDGFLIFNYTYVDSGRNFNLN